jgi:hypothetical protein
MLLHVATMEWEKKYLEVTVSIKLVYNRVPKDSFSPPVKTGFHLSRWFYKYKLDYNMKETEYFVSLQTSAVLAEEYVMVNSEESVTTL